MFFALLLKCETSVVVMDEKPMVKKDVRNKFFFLMDGTVLTMEKLIAIYVLFSKKNIFIPLFPTSGTTVF